MPFNPSTDPNHVQKQLLIAFWAEFSTGKKRSEGTGYPKEAKLAKLKEYAEIVISYKNQKPITERREQFNDPESKLHKLEIARNRNCFVCGDPVQCRHHIIQLQHGGLNSRKNVVSLCHDCHSEIHPWLKQKRPWRQKRHHPKPIHQLPDLPQRISSAGPLPVTALNP